MRAATLFGLLLGLAENASAKCKVQRPGSNSTLPAPLSSASVSAYATASHSFYSTWTAPSNGSYSVPSSYATASHSLYANWTAPSNGSHPVSPSSSATLVSTGSSASTSGSSRSSSPSSPSTLFPTITTRPSNSSLSVTLPGSTISSTSVASSATASTSSLPDGSYSGYITVQETTPSRLARRGIKYVSFNARMAVALDDASRADLVTFYPNGTVVFTNLFVNGVSAGNQTLLGLSPNAATPYSTWTFDEAGNAVLVGSTGFCMDTSSKIVVQKSTPVANACRPVRLIILTSLPSATPSLPSSTSGFPSVTSSSIPSAISSGSGSASLPTISASTTGSFTVSSASITSSGGPLCSATSSAMVAVADASVDRSSYANLVLSRSARLNYRDPPPGRNAVSVKIDTVYDVVMLENSEYITEVTCAQDEITVKVTGHLPFGLVRGWPQSDFVIITNSAGCNTETQRGSFLVKGHTEDADASTVAFAVIAVQWGDISETMTISYGSVAAAASANDKPVYSSTCTNTLTAMRPSITSSAALPSSTTLSPGAQAMMDYIMKQVMYDPEKNEVLVTTFQNPVDLDGGDGAPVSDPDLLDKLKALMKEDGLPDPDALMDEANNATDSSGTCWATSSAPPQLCPTATSCAAAATPTSPSKRRAVGAMPNSGSLDLWTSRPVASTDVILMERGAEEDVDEVFEYVCSDWVEILLTPFEKINEIREFVCGLKELYDAGKQLYEVIQCLKNPFCFNPPEIRVTITYPPAQRWKYTYGWRASWSGMNGATLVGRDAQNYIRCVDCAFAISDLTIDGAITYNVSAKAVTEARNTVRMSSEARLIMQMQTSGAWQGKGTAFVSSLGLGTQQIDSMFAFSPTVVFTLGAEGNTNAPVSSTGGAVLRFDGASVDLDYNSKTVGNWNNFKPAIEMTYPGFRNDAKVNFAPVMTSDVRITMNILKGVLASTSAVTSELAIGFNATYSEAATETCGANQLNLKSYVSARSHGVFDGGARQLIDGTTSNNPIRCLEVPQYFPTRDEISALKESGGDFCTSFIRYRAPVTVLFTGTTTSLVASTTTTTTETSTTTVVSTYTTTATTSTSLAGSVPYYQYATTVYTQGSDRLETAYLKRSEPSPAPDLLKRDPVATPTVAAGWADDKLSYACSQVATGTQTLTRITSVATTYTSTSTATATSTRVVGVAGPMQTVTATSTRYIVTALAGTTSTLAGATTVASACPVQTQAACFRVRTHGHPLVEGQYLGTGVYNGRGHVVAGASIVPEDGVFHLAADGRLVSTRRRTVLQYIAVADPARLRPDTDYVEGWWAGQAKLFGPYDWGANGITNDWSGAGPSLEDARCDLDCASGLLTCAGPANATQLYIFDPEGQVADRNYVFGYPNWYPSGFTDLPFRVMWANAPRNWAMVPITLKVEEAPCSCLR